jgi:hypothetical protein
MGTNMSPQKKNSIRVLNIGAAPLRGIDNIGRRMPQKLAIFNQLNKEWSAENKEYKTLILDKFFGDQLIKIYEKAVNIEEIPVSTCMDYYCIFDALFSFISKKHKKFDIEIDVSGFTKEAFAAAQNVAACFNNVDVVYARSKKADIYTAKRYGRGDERSGPEVVIPTPRVEISNFEDENSRHYKVFQAVYRAYVEQSKRVNSKEQEIIFTSNSVKEHAKEMRARPKKQQELQTIPAGSITQLLHKFHSDGLIRMDAASAKVYNIEMTPFGIGLAQALKLG